MTRHLNEDNDVMNVLDIKQALESNNGVKGIVPYVVEGVPVLSTNVTRITGISLLHNFEYDSNRLRVRKAFESYRSGMNLTKTVNPFLKSSQLSKVIKTKRTYVLLKRPNRTVFVMKKDNSTVDESAMFHCPESECVKQYLS